MTIPARDRLIVALDLPTVAEAEALVDRIGDAVTFYKVGMQLQFAGGLVFAEKLAASGYKVFLDAKLYDIPQTIESAVRNIAQMGMSFLTVHGNAPTVAAAVRGRGDSDLKIFAVTVLTSLDQSDLDAMRYSGTVDELVLNSARQSMQVGADGVIASGKEAAPIRAMAGDSLLITTPGIRPAGSDVGDQKRVMTPANAIGQGADYLVVGRPVNQAEDPRAAAQAIVAEIESAL